MFAPASSAVPRTSPDCTACRQLRGFMNGGIKITRKSRRRARKHWPTRSFSQLPTIPQDIFWFAQAYVLQFPGSHIISSRLLYIVLCEADAAEERQISLFSTMGRLVCFLPVEPPALRGRRQTRKLHAPQGLYRRGAPTPLAPSSGVQVLPMNIFTWISVYAERGAHNIM